MAPSTEDETRILRWWTPLILRSVLVTAVIVLVIGLAAAITRSPDYYVERFRAVQTGAILHQPIAWRSLVHGAARGDPHDLMTVGLVVLTLVPIARVAFTFILFLWERDLVFLAATGYVLAGLIAGVLLGSIG